MKLIFQEFPISGSLRLPILVMEWICTLAYIEIGLVFFLKYDKQKEYIKNYSDMAHCTFFLFFGLMWSFFIVADYYVSDAITTPFLLWNQGSERLLFISFGEISLQIGGILFAYSLEKMKPYLFGKFFFTISYSFSLFLYLIIYLFTLNVPRLVEIPFYFLTFLLLTVYFKDIIQMVKQRRIFLLSVNLVISALVVLFVGAYFSSDYIITNYGLYMRLLGSIIQLVSIIFLFFLFLKFPSFSEFDFKSVIEEIYLINKAGITLYHKSYVKSEDKSEPLQNLLSGVLTSINIVLKEITSSDQRGLSIIKKKGKVLYIFSGELTTGVIMSRKELPLINLYLKEFIIKVEEIYRNVLLNFEGKTKIFDPIENIVSNIFAI
ncbi:MAG: membrane protein of unknown function [Promethearchaeota archaeon]|nr:MAG: membrane protein of unknown function [Candidatus Lokiarchaeota archaeon]